MNKGSRADRQGLEELSNTDSQPLAGAFEQFPGIGETYYAGLGLAY